MKFKFTTLSICLFALMALLMSHSGGRATQFNEGNTGAPGDDNKTCATCHNGGEFGADIGITLTDLDGTEVTQYQAGKTYTVTATISTTSAPGGYGLQMVGLINSDESNAGSMANASTNAQLADLNGRSYLEQAGLSGPNVFTAEWTAPAVGSGAVTFYAAGHAANGNGNSGGDQATSTSVEFGENVVESTKDYIENLFTVSPNPVQDYTTIILDENVNGNISVYSSTGQLVFESAINTSEFVLNLSDFSTGNYLVSIFNSNNNSVSTKQLIKL